MLVHELRHLLLIHQLLLFVSEIGKLFVLLHFELVELIILIIRVNSKRVHHSQLIQLLSLYVQHHSLLAIKLFHPWLILGELERIGHLISLLVHFLLAFRTILLHILAAIYSYHLGLFLIPRYSLQQSFKLFNPIETIRTFFSSAFFECLQFLHQSHIILLLLLNHLVHVINILISVLILLGSLARV